MLDETIKDWRIVGKLGKGGMGEVWVAEQRIVKTKVAIKLLLADISSRAPDVQRFFNEAVAVSKIKHAGIVKIFDVGFTGERAYLVMELLEGETLLARIRRKTRLSLAEVAELGRQIASVLEATHAASITHRDLKPDNIFVVPDHELACKERVRVLDFGIAKLGENTSGLTSTTSMGTPAYMAPEQWNNAAKVDSRADVYSLGCVLFEMCCGRPPFLAASMGEACSMHLNQVPPRATSVVATVPPELDELIATMLVKAPGDRPLIADVTRALTTLAAAHPYVASEVVRLANAVTTPASLSGTSATSATVPSAAIEHRPVAALATTHATAEPQRTAPEPRGRRFRPAVVVAVAGLLAVAGIAIFFATRPEVAPTAAAKLREPTHGLQTLATFREPTPATSGALSSESLWLAARDDFAEACKQPGAPARWCAAAEMCAGQALLMTRKHGDAEARYRAAIALDPTWAAPHLGLHDVRSFNNDLEGALAEVRTAQRLDPTSWTAVLAGARSYSHARRMLDAIAEYQRALTLSPKNPLILAELAMAYNAAGMDADAERTAAEALAIDNTLTHVHLMYADRAIARGDGAAALASADRVLSLKPKNTLAHMFRGDALALLGRHDDAIAAYTTFVELYGEDARQLPDPRVDEIRAAIGKGQLPSSRYEAPAASRAGGSPGSPSKPPKQRETKGPRAGGGDQLELE